MTPDALRLRRFAWVPLVALGASELALLVLLRGPVEGLLSRRHLLWYLPLALHLLPRLALFAWVWPRLREGGPFQALLAAQAALPLLRFGLARWGLPALVAQGALQGIGLQAVALLGPLLELTALGLAFHLRRREPEEGSLAVLASAGFAVLGGGWLALGLLPGLATRFRDPLREHLCADSARAASLAGFLTLLALPLAAWGLTAFGLPTALRGQPLAAWLALPALALGAWSWTRLGARLGPAGRGWRVLTRLGLGLFLLGILGLIALVAGLRGA